MKHSKNDNHEDQVHSGNFDDDFGRAIGAALGELRVDPQDFAAGVAARTEQGEEAIRKSGPGRTLAIAWMRQAAAYLPPFLLPRSLLESSATLGAALAKKSAWKWAPALLALPALIFTLLISSFVWGVRRSAGVERQGTLEDLANYQARMWWKSYRLVSLVTLLLLFWVGRHSPLEALALFALVSILFGLGIFHSLARSGLASRAEIGQRSGTFLLSHVLWGYMLLSEWKLLEVGPLVRLALLLLPVAGGAVCLGLAARDRVGWARRRKQRIALPILGGLSLALMIFFLVGLTRATRADALRYVEQCEAPSGNKFFQQLDNFLGTSVQLAASSGRVPELDALRSRLALEFERLRREEADGSANAPQLWESAALGLVGPEDLEWLSNPELEASLCTERASFLPPARFYIPIAQRLSEGDLDREQRDLIAQRIVRGASEPTRHGSLGDLWCSLMILEQLGRGERAIELAPAVQRDLLATWAAPASEARACFAPGPKLVEREASGRVLPGQASADWIVATDHAIRLMARFGVPAGVDLKALFAYLREQSVRPLVGRHRGTSPKFPTHKRRKPLGLLASRLIGGCTLLATR